MRQTNPPIRKTMESTKRNEPSPNHALQRTAPAVTLAASTAAFPPTMQPARQPPPSLSLGSLGVFSRLVKPTAALATLVSALLMLPACRAPVRGASGGNNTINLNVSIETYSRNDGVWTVKYQAEGDTLNFAVITEPVPGSETAEGHLSFTATSRSAGLHDLGVRKPDGRDVLPITYQLYQVTPHGVIFTDTRISASTFKAFLESRPSVFSIASILAFAQVRARTAKQ